MNPAEQAAHAKIAEVLTARLQERVSRKRVENRVWVLAGAFRERCNCKGLLRRVADAGRVIVWCPQ